MQRELSAPPIVSWDPGFIRELEGKDRLRRLALGNEALECRVFFVCRNLMEGRKNSEVEKLEG
jgi:hypothetical protein